MNPFPTSPLPFNLSIDGNGYEEDQFHQRAEENDARLTEMLAAQAAHREDGSAMQDDEDIVTNAKYSDAEKRIILQKSLHMAASNGDVDRVQKLVNSKVREYIDINGADEEGTAPLIYASCFVCRRFIRRRS